MAKIMKNVFTNLKSPACYSSIENVYQESKKTDPLLTRKKVEEELSKSRTYTIHKTKRIRFKRMKTVPIGFMTDMQADLADFQKVSKENDGYRYLLVGVDVLSRRVFTAPVKSKSSKDMRKAFDILLKKTPEFPQFLYTDKGVEFQAKEMKEYFIKHNIQKHVTQSPDVKAAVAERFIRTIKQRLYKYFTEKQTLRWLDAVDSIVNALNHTKNRSTQMRPVDVNFTNAHELWTRLYGHESSVNKKSKFKEGDHVRISKAKKAFEKGYLPNFTNEIFTIDTVKKRKEPINYRLTDAKGEEILGKFYKEELSKTTAQESPRRIFKIEKVLDKRIRGGKPEYYVKWEGLPLKNATWIRNSDIQ